MLASTDRPPAPSTNDACQPAKVLCLPGSERLSQGRRRFRFGGINFRFRPLAAHDTGDAGKQPAAAERCDDRVDVGKVLENLEAGRSVAADEMVVVERVYEVALHPIRAMLLDRAPALVEGRLHDGGAEPADGAKLRLRRRVHDEDAAARAQLLRREGDALGGVPRTDRPDALAQLARRQLAHGVVGAADLERADGLQGFELEVDLGLSGRSRQTNERRPYGGLIDVFRSVADGVD